MNGTQKNLTTNFNKNMKHLLLIFVLLILIGNCYSQIPKEIIVSLADSIVLANTDKTFLDALKKDTVEISFPWIFHGNALPKIYGDFNCYSRTGDTILYSLLYSFKPISNPECYIIDKNGFHPACFCLEFIQIKSLYLLKEPDFELFIKFYSRIKNVTIVDKQAGIHAAKDHFSEHMRDSHRQQLAYNTIDDKFYWLITKHKGFRKVKNETAIIDAESSNFIRIERDEYFRSFWLTIGDFFGGAF